MGNQNLAEGEEVTTRAFSESRYEVDVDSEETLIFFVLTLYYYKNREKTIIYYKIVWGVYLLL